ncbi:MAG: hypothetical protein IJJ13_10280 [Lachnospiraceae bacterium]|nr:hypothetical protein [Lachnospiraceae bacterium]
MKNTLKRIMTMLLAFLLSAGTFFGAAPVYAKTAVPGSSAVAETPAEGKKAARTILLYVNGANMESKYGLPSKSLNQMMEAPVHEDVNILVLTGGAASWSDSLYTEGMDSVSTECNQVWMMTGATGKKPHGALKLLEPEGIEGAEALSMEDPKMLQSFLDYGVKNYPAKRYDLILWDHGKGPARGFCSDEVRKRTDGESHMAVAEIAEAIHASSIERLDLIDFHACLMGNLEVALALSPYTDYLVCSPDTMPGDGEDLKGWLELLNQDPEVSGWESGKRIVDGTIAHYKTREKRSAAQATLSVVDTKNLLKRMLPCLKELPELMVDEAVTTGNINGKYNYYDEIYSGNEALFYAKQRFEIRDFGNVMETMGICLNEMDNISPEDLAELDNRYTEVTGRILDVLSDQDDSGDDVLYYGFAKGEKRFQPFLAERDATGEITLTLDGYRYCTGLSIFFDMDGSPNGIQEAFRYSKSIDLIQDIPGLDAEAKNWLDAYRKALLRYVLIAAAGRSVAEKLREGKTGITYDMVRQNLKNEQASFEGKEGSVYGLFVKGLEETIGDRALDAWMDQICAQQEREALSGDNIFASVIADKRKKSASAGYEFTVGGTPLGAIEGIYMDLSVGLQDVDAEEVRLSHKALSGEISEKALYRHLEETEDLIEAMAALYKDDTASFTIGSFDGRWYALQDGEGKLHPVSSNILPEQGEAMQIPVNVKLPDEKYDFNGMLVVNFENGTEEGVVLGIQPGDKDYGTVSVVPEEGSVEDSGLILLSEPAFAGAEITLLAIDEEHGKTIEISPKIILDQTESRGLSVMLCDLAGIEGVEDVQTEYYIRDCYGNEMDLSSVVKAAEVAQKKKQGS